MTEGSEGPFKALKYCQSPPYITDDICPEEFADKSPGIRNSHKADGEITSYPTHTEMACLLIEKAHYSVFKQGFSLWPILLEPMDTTTSWLSCHR